MNFKKDEAKTEALAEKLVKRGKLQDAIVEYKKLISGDIQDVRILSIISDLFIKVGQKDDAIKELHKIAGQYEKKGLDSKAIAILKRIIRLNPDNLESTEKLANLYQEQGFSTEARSEFLRLAKILEKKNKLNDAVKMYEKLLAVSPDDLASREILADILTKENQTDKAVDELNTIAELQIKKKDLKAAKKVLNKAKELKPDYSRTLTNLIELLKSENKKKEAMDLIKEILAKDKENIKALYQLGNIHFEGKNYKEAEDIFNQILSMMPKEVEARIKLGKICVQNDQIDKAFGLYEPLIETLVRKNKEEKAIGLLGLLLKEGNVYLPALEKLLEIYRELDQKEGLVIVNRVLLEEYKKENLKEKMLTVYKDLADLSPENEEYYYEFRRLKDELGVGDEMVVGDEAPLKVDEVKEMIDSTLAKADLYADQGLLRNAKRILENLRMRYPDEPKIKLKLEEFKAADADIKASDIASRVGKVAQKETQILDKMPHIRKQDRSSPLQQEPMDDKLSAADIFAETDIIPMAPGEEAERKFFDLRDRIADELEAIKAVHSYQIRGDTTIVEKALTDIVTDFRKALDEKVDKEDFESHYNLGIAFLEQGLIDEAIEECLLAAKSKKLEVDSYGIVSFCYRQKKEYPKALKWLEKALKLSETGSHQSFALKYELASLYEDMQDKSKAVKVFGEVKKWNSEYRDVAEKLKTLEKA